MLPSSSNLNMIEQTDWSALWIGSNNIPNRTVSDNNTDQAKIQVDAP